MITETPDITDARPTILRHGGSREQTGRLLALPVAGVWLYHGLINKLLGAIFDTS